MRIRAAAGVLATTLLLGLCAAEGQAATRYAAPGGATVGACPAGTPCTLEYAIEGAANGDEVVVTAGTYDETQEITNYSATLTVRGPGPGAAAPLIKFSGAARIITIGDLADLRVQSTGFGLAGTARLSRVVVHTTGGVACSAPQVLDSICWSEAGVGVRVLSGTALVRNVTAYGGQYGIQAGPTSSAGPVDMEVSNSIARGDTADLQATGNTNLGAGDLHATVTAHHSNYVTTAVPDADGNTVQSGGSNQSADPKLVALASGNFHQTAQSPTRDQGVATAGQDVDGDDRTLGAGTDIGADEAAGPPSVTTHAPTDVTATAATFHGTAASGGAVTQYRFEYAASPLFGVSTAAGELPAPGGPTVVSARAEGLTPGTLYYVRLVATNAQGSAAGETMTFTTPAGPGPGGGGPGGGGPGGGSGSDVTAPVLGSLRLTNVAFRVASGLTPLTAARKLGTTLSFRVSEPGTAAIAVEQALAGRRSGSRCVAPAKARRGARRCTRWVRRARLTRKVGGVSFSLRFTGRIGSAALSRRLAVGSYRFAVVVTDAAGNRSDRETKAFRIVRR